MSDGPEFQSQDSNESATVTETRDKKSDATCSPPKSAAAAADEASGSAPELGSGASTEVSEPDYRVSRNEKSDDAVDGSTEDCMVRVSSEGDGMREGDAPTVDLFDDSNDKLKAENKSFQGQIDRFHHHFQPQSDVKKFPGSDNNSLLSEFDDFVAAEENGGARTGASRYLGFGLEVGDMVWGKVKSHPWWPGHIYNEAFASPSVRKTKREGHVLVAFYGDSSYGWFEPAELIPFDQHFAEKSQQMNSRTFVKAVEEAVDEASRRRALGLACRCRNPENFRPTNVEGYFSVYVQDFELGGFYSSDQIRKARNTFKPDEILAFMKQLAMAPRDGQHESIGFVEDKAMVFAYRRAVFEQYDETYAQAFAVQPLRPTHPQKNPLLQPVRQPSRAPLSGPMVVAEALGGRKSSIKSVKVKDNSKRDKNLFKRWDDANNSFQLAYKEEAPDIAARYVLQKRTPAVPVEPHNLKKHKDTGFIGHVGPTLTSDAKEALMGQAQPDGGGLASRAISSDDKSHLDKMKEFTEGMTNGFEHDYISSKSMGRPNLSEKVTLPSTVDETSQPSHLDKKNSVDIKHDENAELSAQCEDSRQTEQGLLTVADGGDDMQQVKCENNAYSSLVEAKNHEISAVKKIKGHKRPADDMNSKTSAMGEKKKKKKKDFSLQPTSAHLASGKTLHLSGKSIQIGLPPREDLQVDAGSHNFPPMDTTGDVSFELPQLLGDLQALALDPFHGYRRKIPVAVRQFFMRFRSLVYQKSLVLSPPAESKPEVRISKSPLSVRASESPDDHVRASPHVKVVKQIVRPDDPTRAGQKRAPSDRKEEIAAKSLNKIKRLKTLAAEKGSAGQKTSDSETQRGEGKESFFQAPSKLGKPDLGKESVSRALPKSVKPDLARKAVHPTKAVEPTTLVIKFPPQTSLPSIPELKARFARFGPMDQSGFRVFWKSCTCRVIFLHKADAQAAYKYSVANQSLFGNAAVSCFLRESGDSASDVPEVSKGRADDGADETPQAKDPSVAYRPTPVSSLAQQQRPLLPQPTKQLKSCLKKPTRDEPGQVSGNGGSSRKGNTRVKFMLSGEESSRGEQLMMSNRNFNNNASFADDGAPPVAMDFNSKNVEKVTSQHHPLPPMLPLPTTHFMKTPQHNMNNTTELATAPRNTPKFINKKTAPVTATTVDISQQMISLLARCSDVVTDVSGLLGYVPYHSL